MHRFFIDFDLEDVAEGLRSLEEISSVCLLMLWLPSLYKFVSMFSSCFACVLGV